MGYGPRMVLGEGWHRHRDRRTGADEVHIHGPAYEPGHEHPLGELAGLELGPAAPLEEDATA